MGFRKLRREAGNGGDEPVCHQGGGGAIGVPQTNGGYAQCEKRYHDTGQALAFEALLQELLRFQLVHLHSGKRVSKEKE